MMLLLADTPLWVVLVGAGVAVYGAVVSSLLAITQVRRDRKGVKVDLHTGLGYLAHSKTTMRGVPSYNNIEPIARVHVVNTRFRRVEIQHVGFASSVRRVGLFRRRIEDTEVLVYKVRRKRFEGDSLLPKGLDDGESLQKIFAVEDVYDFIKRGAKFAVVADSEGRKYVRQLPDTMLQAGERLAP